MTKLIVPFVVIIYAVIGLFVVDNALIGILCIINIGAWSGYIGWYLESTDWKRKK